MRCPASSCCCWARVTFGISLFSAAYFRDGEGSPALVCLQYHVFLASMAFVLIADDAYLFMVTWESMALSSYFLVTTEHHSEQNRKAGFIYLLIAHLGAIAILLSFGVLHGGHGDYTFDALRARRTLSPVVGDDRFPARVLRFRRQGRHAAAARVAAGSASGGAFAGVGAHVRRHAEDRDLRHGARHLRSHRRHPLGMGTHGAALRRGDLALRRALRADAARSEAPARVPLGREHRHHPDRHRALDGVHRQRPSRSPARWASSRGSITRSTTRSSRRCSSSARARY